MVKVVPTLAIANVVTASMSVSLYAAWPRNAEPTAMPRSDTAKAIRKTRLIRRRLLIMRPPTARAERFAGMA